MPEQPAPPTESQTPKRRSWVGLGLLAAALFVCFSFAALKFADEMKRRRIAALPTEFPLLERPNPENFSPIQVVDRYPPVSGYEMLDVAAASKVLEDDELVLAVEIDGQARAYPINMMTGPSREIINDHLAETAIAATW